MIGAAERQEWADRFGVDTDQIERDHFISHTLVAIATDKDRAPHFYGGTALCRSYLDGSRLSEDIDLLHNDPPGELRRLEKRLPELVRREFPTLAWETLSATSQSAKGLVGADGLAPIHLEIHKLGPDTRAWEFATTSIALRYSDLVGSVDYTCPTLATFAAMKALAWSDRKTPRDLFDLAGLAGLGGISDEADALLSSARGYGFIAVDYDRVPAMTAVAWETELGAQVGTLPSPAECLGRVRAAFGELSGAPK